MSKMSGKEQQTTKSSIDAQAGYSQTIENGRAEELQNYDPVAASFLLYTICNGDYYFTLEAALRSSEVSLEEFAPVTALGSYYSVSVVGQRVADVLWKALNVSTYYYGWNGATHATSYRPSLPPPDGIDRFVWESSFLPRPDMVAGDILECRREVAEMYQTTRSAMGGDINGAGGEKPGMIGMLAENFASTTGELATLAGKLGPPPGSLLAEFLFPGSSQTIEVCSQYHGDGNWKSLICATETHMFSLDFGTS